jgi:hypothetical protein
VETATFLLVPVKKNKIFIRLYLVSKDSYIFYTWISGSKLETAMDDFCGNRAQHIGVANVRQRPQRIICNGAPSIGNRLRNPFFSR